MKKYINPDRITWSELCRRPSLELEFLEGTVKNIINRVRTSGDKALKEFSLQFDKVGLDDFKVSNLELSQSTDKIPEDLKQSIRIARDNIYKFHEAQGYQTLEIETMPGVRCWRKALPIEKVGIYIPGGTAPLFSTLLMLGIPAKIAGCNEIILCTPPDNSGSIHPAILFTAQEIGIENIYKVGGAQAIAAMAFGTETVPAVYKIFGPGNQYVTKAKQLVNTEGVAIDMPAGPSEVLVFADQHANPDFIAADLLSQAEHGTDSQVVLISTDENLMQMVNTSLQKQLQTLPRKNLAVPALQNSLMIQMTEENEIIDFINAYAPEHLIINTINCNEVVEGITNAGSVFLGPYTPESVGDYASGTNHTLPTNGYAKAYSGVSLASFQKFITYQQLSKEGLERIGPAVEHMAQAEELIGHQKAVEIRLK